LHSNLCRWNAGIPPSPSNPCTARISCPGTDRGNVRCGESVRRRSYNQGLFDNACNQAAQAVLDRLHNKIRASSRKHSRHTAIGCIWLCMSLFAVEKLMHFLISSASVSAVLSIDHFDWSANFWTISYTSITTLEWLHFELCSVRSRRATSDCWIVDLA